MSRRLPSRPAARSWSRSSRTSPGTESTASVKIKDPVLIGQIVSAVGIKGEVKIYSYAESPDRFSELESLYLGDKGSKGLSGDRKGSGAEPTACADFAVYRILSVRYKGQTPILSLEGVTDRNAAEALQFRYVYMDAEDLPGLPEGEYYVRDLVGLPVVTEDGRELGVLKDIQTETPQKLYVIAVPAGTDGASAPKEILLPGVPEFILEKDPAKGRILVRLPEGLLEL